jgi:hypothetical protein
MRLHLLLPALLSLGTLPMLAGTAQADQAAASACASKLSKEGQLLYEKASPTEVARPLVMNGTMSRGTARAAAEAAGECMKLAK